MLGDKPVNALGPYYTLTFSSWGSAKSSKFFPIRFVSAYRYREPLSERPSVREALGEPVYNEVALPYMKETRKRWQD